MSFTMLLLLAYIVMSVGKNALKQSMVYLE